MYVGKRIKSILSVLLICGLLVVCVPCRAYAAAPLVLGPALKYAIAASVVACGVYAANSDGLDYVVESYWNSSSESVKKRWMMTVAYGAVYGKIVVDRALNSDLADYLQDLFSDGMSLKQEVYQESLPITGASSIDTTTGALTFGVREWTGSGGTYISLEVYHNGDQIERLQTWSVTQSAIDNYLKSYFDYTAGSSSISFYWCSAQGNWSREFIYLYALGGAVVLGGSVVTGTHDYTGDAPFGQRTNDKDLKIPCPPVPAAEWPDNWIDDLQEEMNRTGNPTLDDETSIEEWEDEYEWYLDEFGNIYKVKKGQQPKKPEDEPLRIPGPPFPAPDVPKNYPTEDDPDLTVEHHPPQTTVTENPDGSRTETTTQTTTTTKKWWDPSSQRWRTTTTDTTTTTTVDFAPDGTETGRTTTTTTQPKGEREETAQPDDTAIDWEPLRRGLYELTEKFPFCLPWDLMRGIQSLESSQWDRKIRIEVGDGIWPAMVIDLTMFDRIASITRVILLIVFDLGLIFGTRKLMGGDV